MDPAVYEPRRPGTAVGSGGLAGPMPPAVQRCILSHCGATFGIDERIYVCPQCGGPLEIDLGLQDPKSIARFTRTGDPNDLRQRWRARLSSFDARDRSGVWRFREVLPFGPDPSPVTLLEGNTPLYDAPRCAEYCGLPALRLKHQGCNPTGSFKDTGMTVAVAQALRLGARTVVCASTGNTAASLAAYAARAGLQCAILLPQGQISAAKLAQSMDYGAAILEIEGNFDDCMRLIQELGAEASIYVANSINPFRIEGQKTVAFELGEQCQWEAPKHVVVPGGNLGNSSAFGKGFREMLALGLIREMPKLHVIQAAGAAPLAETFAELQQGGASRSDGGALSQSTAIKNVPHPKTLATAIKIGAPVSWRKSLQAVLKSGGEVLAVSEQDIADAKAIIGRDGIGCEPASATTVAGIRKLVAAGKIARGESVTAVLTGHLLKDPDYVSQYHRGALDAGSADAPAPIRGAFQDAPRRVAASKSAILASLKNVPAGK